MSREEFKILAYGQYSYLNIGQTIDRDRLEVFVQGALFAWDSINKKRDPVNHPYYRPHHPNNPSNKQGEV